MSAPASKSVLVLCTAPAAVCVELMRELVKTFPIREFVLFASISATETIKAETGLEVMTYAGRIHLLNWRLWAALLQRRFDTVVYLYENWWHDNVRITLLYMMALLGIRFRLYQKTRHYLKEEVFQEFYTADGARRVLLYRLFVALPVFFVLATVRKVYRVRFHGFNGSFGDILLEAYYLYVNKRMRGKSHCLCYYLRSSDNRFLAAKVKHAMHVFPVGRQVHEIAYLFGKGPEFTTPMYEKLQPQALEQGDKVPQMFGFSPSEEQNGRCLLRNMGLSRGGYVLIHSRDPHYFHQYYHDVDDLQSLNRENAHRDADFNFMLAACQMLKASGIDVMRYGRNHAPLTGEMAEYVYDYPNSPYRSDMMDFYIAANCRFMIGSCSGACNVTYIFRKPFLLVNVCNLYLLARREAVISYLKRFYDLKSELPLTLSELCERGLHRQFYHASEYADLDVGISENTPEELRDVVKEMTMRLDGSWEDTREDIEAREAFDAIYLHYRRKELPGAKIYAPISTTFLRRNTHFIS